MQRDFVLTNEQGIHARPATELVQLANKFQSNMTLSCQGTTVDMKSIMGVLSLGVTRGSLITILIDGPDETEAMQAIRQMIQKINQRV